MVIEIKLNHSALVTLVRNFFWEVPCHHNKENICKLADACEKKILRTTRSYVSERYLMTESKLDFIARLRQQNRDQKVHFGVQKPLSSQPFFAACLLTNACFSIVRSQLITIKTCPTIPNHFRIDCTSHICLSFSRSACISIALGLLLLD